MNDAVESIAAVMPPGTLEGSAAWYGRDYQDISDFQSQFRREKEICFKIFSSGFGSSQYVSYPLGHSNCIIP